MAYFVTEFFGDNDPDNKKTNPFLTPEAAEDYVVGEGYWFVIVKGKSKMIGTEKTHNNPRQRDRLAEIVEE